MSTAHPPHPDQSEEATSSLPPPSAIRRPPRRPHAAAGPRARSGPAKPIRRHPVPAPARGRAYASRAAAWFPRRPRPPPPRSSPPPPKLLTRPEPRRRLPTPRAVLRLSLTRLSSLNRRKPPPPPFAAVGAPPRHRPDPVPGGPIRPFKASPPVPGLAGPRPCRRRPASHRRRRLRVGRSPIPSPLTVHGRVGLGLSGASPTAQLCQPRQAQPASSTEPAQVPW